jgi:hypothetical protein
MPEHVTLRRLTPAPLPQLARLFREVSYGFSSWKITGKGFDPRVPDAALALTPCDMDTF